jgi:hypothetical protein
MGWFGLHLGSERCVVNLHGCERQKVIMLMGPTFPTPGPTMTYDPWLAYGAWVIQCDAI